MANIKLRYLSTLSWTVSVQYTVTQFNSFFREVRLHTAKAEGITMQKPTSRGKILNWITVHCTLHILSPDFGKYEKFKLL